MIHASSHIKHVAELVVKTYVYNFLRLCTHALDDADYPLPIITHHSTFLRTPMDISRLTKVKKNGLLAASNFSCSWSTMETSTVVVLQRWSQTAWNWFPPYNGCGSPTPSSAASSPGSDLQTSAVICIYEHHPCSSGGSGE